MERRKFTRIRLEAPARFSTLQVEGYHDGTLTDISYGGCFFPLAGEMEIGEKCNITISVGEGLLAESYLFEGNVVRKSPEGIGISFTDPFTPSHRDTIQKIISYYDNNS